MTPTPQKKEHAQGQEKEQPLKGATRSRGPGAAAPSSPAAVNDRSQGRRNGLEG